MLPQDSLNATQRLFLCVDKERSYLVSNSGKWYLSIFFFNVFYDNQVLSKKRHYSLIYNITGEPNYVAEIQKYFGEYIFCVYMFRIISS